MSKPADDWARLTQERIVTKDPADDLPEHVQDALKDYMHSHRDATVKYWQGRWQDEARRVHKLAWTLLLVGVVALCETVALLSVWSAR